MSKKSNLAKIGLGSINTCVNDYEGNTKKILELIADAQRQEVGVLVLDELALSGYGLEDRIHWQEVTENSWHYLQEIVKATRGMIVVVGLPVNLEGEVYNGSAMVVDGKLEGITLKEDLPSYDVFYENRHTSASFPGFQDQINGIPVGDHIYETEIGRVALTICEDDWSAAGPACRRALAGAQIILNSSASNFCLGKNAARRQMIGQRSTDYHTVHAYSNKSGNETGRILFDGGGFIFQNGKLIAEAEHLVPGEWHLTTGVVDLAEIDRERRENTTWRKDVEDARRAGARDQIKRIICTGQVRTVGVQDYPAITDEWFPSHEVDKQKNGIYEQYMQELDKALSLSLADYTRKNGFKSIKLALSGGKDSALCLVHMAKAAAILKEYYNYPITLHTVYLPGTNSSQQTEEAARLLVEDLNQAYGADIEFRVEDVKPVIESINQALKPMIEKGNFDPLALELVRQNTQARARAGVVLGWVNADRGLLLTTGNMSEVFTGYFTAGGDNQGGYNPLVNLPKTVVKEKLLWEERKLIARNFDPKGLKLVNTLKPSAELAPNQEDEDDLPPYPVLDKIMYITAEMKKSLPETFFILKNSLKQGDFSASSDKQIVEWITKAMQLFKVAQWKRDQSPIGLKLYGLDLDPKTGFRYPITMTDQSLWDLKKILQLPEAEIEAAVSVLYNHV